jgi:hypothetical protein
MTAHTSGTYNTACGAFSMAGNTTGIENTAVGGSSLVTNSTGSQNTALGYIALNVNSSGSLNTAIGFKALYLNQTGTYNVATGSDCLWSNTTGSYNVGGGYYALGLNTTGTYNIAFGVAALGGIVGNSNRNIAIGTEAGRYTTGSTVLTGASNCIFIGDIVKAGANNVSNCTVIGNGITGSGSNTTTINSTAVTSTKIDGSAAHILDVTGGINASTFVKTGVFTIATLPTAAGFAGRRAYVTNNTANPNFGDAVSTGSTGFPVYSNGTNWRIG